MKTLLTILLLPFLGCGSVEKQTTESYRLVDEVLTEVSCDGIKPIESTEFTIREKTNNVKGILVILHRGGCGACYMEMAGIEEIKRKYKERGLLIVSIIYSDGYGNTGYTALAAYACDERLSYGYSVISAIDPLQNSIKYLGHGVPFNVLLDKDMKLKYTVLGYDKIELERSIELLLTGE